MRGNMMMDGMTALGIPCWMGVMRPEAREYRHNAPTTASRDDANEQLPREPETIDDFYNFDWAASVALFFCSSTGGGCTAIPNRLTDLTAQ